jgi:hypothetical protein
MKLPKIPQLMDDADYAELVRKRDERAAERKTARDEREIILDRIRKRQASTLPDTSQAERVAAIAFGRPIAQQPEPDLVLLGGYNTKIRELDEAVEFLNTQMRNKANRLSIGICGQLKPHHDELARSMIMGLLEAREKILAYNAFIETLRDKDITTHHFPNPDPYFMAVKDRCGQFASWLNDCVKLGLIKQSEVPPQLDYTR